MLTSGCTGKSIWRNPKETNTQDDMLKNLLSFVKNTTLFVDKVKILFEVKGFVASGLKATVMVNKVPLCFSDS